MARAWTSGTGGLARPVGFGLAARGEVSDVVAWSEAARQAGLDSVWIHDSYFEREAVTYTSAIASQVRDLRVGLGALNPYTRHPVVVAMTVSALDEMAPGRVILALGTGLPLRLAQMGIPYTPQEGVERVSQCIDVLRALWRGERVPLAAPGVPVPPVQPMFPPVHQVPIYIAAYRGPMLELAGQKADGYLARPAESIPALRIMLKKIRDASVAAGRPESAVSISGYLLSYVDRTRREALNRAKREPFVIYMLGVQSDVALRRAGLDPGLRDRVFAAWRAEDYHGAANLIPDEFVDAFILCGTRDEVAARAQAYRDAGMDMPVLQPCVQEDDQVREVMAAAVLYGQGDVATARLGVEAEQGEAEGVPALAASGASGTVPVWRKLAATYEIARPFSFTASVVPVLAGGAVAAVNDVFSWPLFLLSLLGGLMLHVGTNVTNEIYDVRKGVDAITSPRASYALLKGRLVEREAFVVAALAFAAATAVGVALIMARGWPVVAFGLLGLLGGWGYTAPPLQLKYRAAGLPLVFLLMGPLMVVGAYYVVSGGYSNAALVASIPVGLLVTAILHGNEWRDIGDDARAGIRTFSIAAGRRWAHWAYVGLVLGAYITLALAVAVQVLPPLSLLAMLSLPLLVRAVRASELGATGQQRAIAMIDLETAQLHAAFGALMAFGLALAALTRAA